MLARTKQTKGNHHTFLFTNTQKSPYKAGFTLKIKVCIKLLVRIRSIMLPEPFVELHIQILLLKIHIEEIIREDRGLS